MSLSVFTLMEASEFVLSLRSYCVEGFPCETTQRYTSSRLSSGPIALLILCSGLPTAGPTSNERVVTFLEAAVSAIGTTLSKGRSSFRELKGARRASRIRKGGSGGGGGGGGGEGGSGKFVQS